MQRLFLSTDGAPISAITIEEMMELLRYTVTHGAIGPEELVESAGRSAFTVVWQRVRTNDPEKPVLVLAGTGYAGAVSLCVARHLSNHGVSVDYMVAAGDPIPVDERQRGACRLSDCREIERVPTELSRYGVIIDALIGLESLQAPSRDIASIISEIQTPERTGELVSFETPSGVDADTGACGPIAFHADRSIAFALPKTGMGAAECGELVVADIGIPSGVYRRLSTVAHPCDFRDEFVVPLRSM
jgi:NAD(P)H-hydrate epimerase